MTKSQFSTVGAVLTLLLALRSFWPPLISWWPPQHLFWPLVLLAGALGLLWPQRLPPILRRVAAHAEFGALFTAVVWAQLWLYGGFFWLFAALPLALAFWRGPGWNWKWSGFSPSQRGWLGALALALVMLRSTWMTASLQTAGMLTGGMQYGLNTYNHNTGYYEWGFQYTPLMNYLPGITLEYPFSGVQIRGGAWVALGCWLLAAAAFCCAPRLGSENRSAQSDSRRDAGVVGVAFIQRPHRALACLGFLRRARLVVLPAVDATANCQAVAVKIRPRKGYSYSPIAAPSARRKLKLST